MQIRQDSKIRHPIRMRHPKDRSSQKSFRLMKAHKSTEVTDEEMMNASHVKSLTGDHDWVVGRQSELAVFL
jgi:hypothetical protein